MTDEERVSIEIVRKSKELEILAASTHNREGLLLAGMLALWGEVVLAGNTENLTIEMIRVALEMQALKPKIMFNLETNNMDYVQ